jgi:DNA-directed RNA polymerase subunit H (RpoH/RPB5)
MKYYKICQTVTNVLQRRGYTPLSDCLVTPYLQSEETFIEQFTENPVRSRLVFKYFNESTQRKFIVLFAVENNIGRQNIMNYITTFQDYAANDAWLIVDSFTDSYGANKKPVSSMAENVISSLQGMRIDIYEDNELVYNILDHCLQPSYELVPQNEHASVFQTFTSADKLPRMRRDDPISKLLGFRPKDIVKTKSTVETSGTQICYLCVV